MDKFVIIKSSTENFHVRGRQDVVQALCSAVKCNTLVCVWGDPGVGKSYLVKKVLSNTLYEIECHMLKTDFMSRCANMTSHVLIDDFDVYDCKLIIDIKKSICKGSTIIICNSPVIDNSIHVPTFTEDDINVLWPGHPRAARMCKGNLHNFKFYKQFSDIKDVFKTPKGIIKDLLSIKKSSYICDSFEEHGHSLSIVHENYVDATLGMDDMCEIIDSISLSDVFDIEIYKNCWDFIEYFQCIGIAKPCFLIDGTLCYNKIRPGSVWTKFNNFKMRQSKLKKFKMDVTTIVYIFKLLCMGNTGLASSYNINSSDIDTINHLCLGSKLKSSGVQNLKKRVSSFCE